ncbi:MAG: tetratricopeptide repeat protein [Candidatus Polarisedimenticolia bacterium]
MKRIVVLGAAAGMALTVMAVAAEPARDVAFYFKQGMEAYQRKDYEASRESFARALELSPGHLRIVYNLAAASALAGKTDDALGLLERIASMKLWYDLEADGDFASLKDKPRFLAVVQSMASTRKPAGGGEVAFRLGAADFIPEGIAHDPQTGDFFVGSVRQRAISRVSARGEEAPFVTQGRDGIWSVLGLAVDAPRRTLWACSTALPNMMGSAAKEPSRGAVFAFDLKDGSLRARQDVAGGAEGHECNDLTVSSAGDVYLSDSRKGSIVKIAAGRTPEVFLPEGTLGSPQGLALAPDGARLYVADYARGIHRVDLPSRTVTLLGVPDDVTTRGVDGLIFKDGALLAIQNGVNPHRVTRFVLDPDGSRIVRQEILGMSHPLYDEPTLGVLAGGALHYIANSQWGKFSQDGTSLPSEGLVPPAILRLPL